MSLFERPLAADRLSGDGTTTPCLILGTLPGEKPGDFPFFLIVKPNGELTATEMVYLVTKFRWNEETQRWDDLLPMYELGELMVAETGETGE